MQGSALPRRKAQRLVGALAQMTDNDEGRHAQALVHRGGRKVFEVSRSTLVTSRSATSVSVLAVSFATRKRSGPAETSSVLSGGVACRRPIRLCGTWHRAGWFETSDSGQSRRFTGVIVARWNEVVAKAKKPRGHRAAAFDRSLHRRIYNNPGAGKPLFLDCCCIRTR